MIRDKKIQKINEVLISLAFFSLSYRHEITSILIYIIFLNSLYNFFKDKTFQLNKINAAIILLISYFTIDLIGLTYTENINFGLKDLESKLLFIIVPFIYFTNNFNKDIVNKSLNYFKIGTIISLSILLTTAIINYQKNNIIPNYVDFSLIMHPTYYSIYLLTAFILQIELKLIKKKNWILNLFLILTIAFGIILTNSKSGILCFILLCIYYIVKLVITTKEFYINKVISLLIIIFFTSTLIIVNKKGIKNSRLQELTTILNFPVQKEYTNFYNSTEIRIIIWRSVKEVIINNKLFGTGTGDIKDELKKEFYKVRFINGVENNYNCHNQYLQIISTFGIILGSFVIILFINYLYQNIKNKNKIAIIFTLIFLFNSIFESTLESKAGLELFVLFCLVLTQNKSTTNENNRIIVN